MEKKRANDPKKPILSKRAKQSITTKPIQIMNTENNIIHKENITALRILVKSREDFQLQRTRMDNRLSRKADGTPTDADERMIRIDDADMFISISEATRAMEAEIEKKFAKVLKRFPIYTHWLKDVLGVGPSIAATIISGIDIEKATTVSKIWQYCGMNPDSVNGKKRVKTSKPKAYQPESGKVVKRAEDYVIVETTEKIRGDKLTPGFISPYNKYMKKTLLGILSGSMIKAGLRWVEADEQQFSQTPDTYRKEVGNVKKVAHIKSRYVQFYMDYKHRLSHSSAITNHRQKGKVVQMAWKDVTPGHRDMAAKRYMVKMFLVDLYKQWRSIEGLPVRDPYQEQYLGHKHVA